MSAERKIIGTVWGVEDEFVLCANCARGTVTNWTVHCREWDREMHHDDYCSLFAVREEEDGDDYDA